MTYSLLAARAAIGAAALALIALAALHILKPDIHPSRTMISQYALGRHGWVMALCFAAFGAASACLFAALIAHVPSLLGRIGLAFLLAAAVGLAMAARFPMDPVSTPREQMSFTGKMHGVAFMIGVPCQILAVLLLSLALGNQTVPRVAAAAGAHRGGLAQPRRHDRDHVDRGSREAAKSKWTGKISRLSQPVVHGRLWRVADGRRVADGSLIKSASTENDDEWH